MKGFFNKMLRINLTTKTSKRRQRLGTLLTIITIIELTASEVLSPYGHRNG